MRIRSWTYDADVHCPECAGQRFGDYVTEELWGLDAPQDSEGNEIHPVYGIDEVGYPERGEYCGTCHAEIVAPETNTDAF